MKILFYILCSVAYILTNTTALAQDRSIVDSRSGGSDGVVSTYEAEIEALKARLTQAANKVGEIKDCHNQRMLYTTSGCVNPITPEQDPSKANHADISKPVQICPSGEVHQWNGTSWSCKEIRKTVNSGVGADKETWHTSGYESCADYFVRPCTNADATCPGTGNPVGDTCDSSVDNICRYVLPNKKQFMIGVCR